jgi:hypothetical protein
VRAYPQTVAGTPSSWSYDPSTATFALSYSTTLPGGDPGAGLETDIFVPARHYPHGYRVKVSGASVVSAPTAGTLRLCNTPGAAKVSVTVMPDTGGSTGPPDTSAQSPSDCPAPANASPPAAAVSAPAAAPCVSNRRFVIHVTLRRGVRLLGGTARIAGRRFPIRRGRRPHATVDLRGLPAGRFRLVVTLRIRRHGRASTLRVTRRYRTCTPHA